MTKQEAADILVEAYQGTPGDMRSRRAKHRRQKLIDGDHLMIRAMYMTAHGDGQEPTPEVSEAMSVLMPSEQNPGR